MNNSINTKKLLFVGGDLRQIRAINEASGRGNEVYVLGFDAEYAEKMCEKIQMLWDFSEVDDSYDAIILPLPYSIDGKTVNAPLYRKNILLDNFFECLSTKNKILAGRCDQKIKKMAETHRIMLVDYLCREELAMLNAILTAEGAIQIAMEETPFSIHSSECLVIGNGRIGKILAKMLRGIGAKVTVAARKKGDIAHAYAMGNDALSIVEMGNTIGKYNIIFNTAPSLILDFHLLSRLKKDVLIVDLASKPGGVDFDEARRLGIKVIWALSLPGKVAPDTAGDIICNTILNILEEMEVKE